MHECVVYADRVPTAHVRGCVNALFRKGSGKAVGLSAFPGGINEGPLLRPD